MNKEAIFKMDFDYGRMGSLEGIFISTKEMVEKLIKNEVEVDFGECLGKHSEVIVKLKADEITFVSDSEEVVSIFKKHNLGSGYNPFDQYHYDNDTEEEMTILQLVEKLS